MSEVTADMAVLPLIADPARYTPCKWDLLQEPEKRGYWIGLFRKHFPSLLNHAEQVAAHDGQSLESIQQRTARAREIFFRYLDEVTEQPDRHGSLDILEICYERERVLRRCGIGDAYRLVKAVETESALKLLPQVLAQLDAMSPAQRDVAIIKGVFAGNVFDLGATKTQERFQNERVDFMAILGELRDRPWLIDDLDAWRQRLTGAAHERALLFVDNAGPDVVLGMIPFGRYLLQRGTRVIITANTEPSLNDVTYDELVPLMQRIAEVDEPIAAALNDGRLKLAPSGNNAPLIDLTRVSVELVAEMDSDPVDLLVLEGMGRAIESNLHVTFNVDTLKLAMVKDPGVADALGGEVYDLVMKYEPAP